jgi:TonB-linked SusC/RagA family outer membrane protein
MITTKKGKSGEKPIVTFSSKTGISNYAKRFDIITDPALYATLDNESRYNAGSTQLYVGDYYDGVYYPSPQEIRNGTWKYGTNWEDVIYRTGITQDYNLSIRGSTDKTQYALSGGYFNQKGIQIGSDYERITAKANINHKVYNFMSVGIDAYINTGNNQKTDNISVRRSPVFPVYDNSGNYFMINSRDDHHPVALVENVLNDTKSFDFYGIAYADFNIIDGLTLRTQAGYKNGNDTQDRYDPMVYTSSGIENKGSGYINTSNNNKTLFEAYATYKKQIRKHDFSIMGGFSGEMNQSRSLRGTGKGFANDVMRNEDLASAIKQEVGNSYSKRVLQSWMVRANYIFDNRFLFTFTGRADGASVLATGHKWNFFPGVAGSWKIHEEEWMKPVNHLLSEAKLRISYGATGNQSISPYATMFRITNQANYYLNNDFVAGYGPGTMGQDYSTYTHIWKGLVNQSLTWERTTQLNLGLDLGFLNQRFYFTADAYRKYTTNLLRDSMLPPSSASDKLRVNNGEVLNKGIELGFGGKVVRTRDFVWNAGVIFAMNRMTVEKLEFYDTAGNLVDYEVRTDAGVDFNADARSILKVGYPLGVFYGYKYDGIIQSYDEGYALGFTGQGAAPGEQKFKNLVDLMDENGNYINEGKIDSNDKTIIGNPEPKFTASLNTSFDYKNFDLSLNFNCVYGNDIFNTAKLNSAKAMIQRWTTDNSNSDYPRQRYGRKWLVSDYFIEDGSYLKLSSATFGYTHYFKKAISSARLYVTGQNLFTLTDFSGYDPETYEDGIYWGGYPQQRVFTMGVNITF